MQRLCAGVKSWGLGLDMLRQFRVMLNVPSQEPPTGASVKNLLQSCT